MFIYSVGETGTGCHIFWFLIFEEAVFTVFLSIICISRNMFPWLYFPRKFEAIMVEFGYSEKQVLQEYIFVRTFPDSGLVVTGYLDGGKK